ncbi:MAG: hypothetical protein ACQPRJ_05610 [Solitalea-like symbiont of Acarus siro]
MTFRYRQTKYCRKVSKTIGDPSGKADIKIINKDETAQNRNNPKHK